ncbi:MAG: TetR/AcrR family transcriptional regulator [Myxococcota bacterium]
MAEAKTGKQAWIDAAVGALAAGGVEAVRVERLARALGVTKGSFYWHFADRGALLESVVDAWEAAGTEAVIAAVEAGGGDARARARALWAQTSGDDNLTAELALRDWGRRDPAIAARIQRVDNRRMGYLRSLLGELFGDTDDIEAKAMLLYSLLIGNYFIAAKHGRRSRRRVLRDAVELLLGPEA